MMCRQLRFDAGGVEAITELSALGDHSRKDLG